MNGPQDPELIRAAGLLSEAKALAEAADPGQAAAAAPIADRGVLLLRSSTRIDPASRLLLAEGLLVRGNAMRNQGSYAEAMEAYDEGIAVLNDLISSGPSSFEVQETLANVWTNRGIALLSQGVKSVLEEAIRSFDQAIAIRNGLARQCSHPWLLYGLAAGWMNKGDALTRIGGNMNARTAVDAYDEALAHLRSLPLDENQLFKKRYAIAWMNRGISLQGQGTIASNAEAVHSFDESIAALSSDGEACAEFTHILACAWMNRGNALLREGGVPSNRQAFESAKNALKLLRDTEANSVQAAEVGFKARYIFCQSAGNLLAERTATGEEQENIVVEATDAVDEGLLLARKWAAQGVDRFSIYMVDLFRFGSRVYQIFQPHFVAEFLMENLDPGNSPGADPKNSVMHRAALEALWGALRDLQKDGFKSLNTSRYETLLAKLHDLRGAEQRLAELRQQYLS